MFRGLVAGGKELGVRNIDVEQELPVKNYGNRIGVVSFLLVGIRKVDFQDSLGSEVERVEFLVNNIVLGLNGHSEEQ